LLVKGGLVVRRNSGPPASTSTELVLAKTDSLAELADEVRREVEAADSVQGLLSGRGVPVYAGVATDDKATQLCKAADTLRGSAFIELDWYIVQADAALVGTTASAAATAPDRRLLRTVSGAPGGW